VPAIHVGFGAKAILYERGAPYAAKERAPTRGLGALLGAQETAAKLGYFVLLPAV